MKSNEKVFVNKVCHSRGMLSGIYLIPSCCSNLIKENSLYYNNGEVGDPRQKPSGMTANLITTLGFTILPLVNCAGDRTAPALYPALQACGVTKRGAYGFTLIELLVVVLIIGILAAVALPQYQKAVTKSRTTKLKINMEALIRAQKVYYLTNGKFTNDLSELDITLDPVAVGCNMLSDNQAADCWSQRIKGLRYNCTLSGPAGKQNCYCVSPKENVLAETICKSQGELTSIASENYNYYTVNYYK